MIIPNSKWSGVGGAAESPCDRCATNPLPFPGKAAQQRAVAERHRTATATVSARVRAASRELRALRPLPAELHVGTRASIAKKIDAMLATLEGIDDALSGGAEASDE